MTKKLNRCAFLATSPGEGDFVYASTVPLFQSPNAAGAGEGDLFYYIAEAGSQWEIGSATWEEGVASRNVLESSNGGDTVDFTAIPKVRLGVVLAADFNLQADAFQFLASGSDGVPVYQDRNDVGVFEQIFTEPSPSPSALFQFGAYQQRVTTSGSGGQEISVMPDPANSLLGSRCVVIFYFRGGDDDVVSIDVANIEKDAETPASIVLTRADVPNSITNDSVLFENHGDHWEIIAASPGVVTQEA